MEKTKNQYSSIRKKLTAAVAMLLIAAIMVVNSTYAWFTLSTAPEVTGIQTQVGANGNLEIALASSNSAERIASAVGNSYAATDDWAVTNLTWGNLVNLSAGYGLDSIKLLPSRLNIADGKVSTQPLKVPVYGNDGRVSSLSDSTLYGKFLNGAFTSDTNYRGVRAIGTTSSLTAQQIAYKNAVGKVSENLSAALRKINASLSANGETVANIVLAKASGEATYDITGLNNIIAAFENANKDIEEAFKQVAIAKAAKQYENDDTAWAGAYATLSGDIAWNALKNQLTGITLVNDYETAKALVAAAKTAYPASGAAAADWDTTKAVLNNIIDLSKVTVNDNYDITSTLNDEQIAGLASDIFADGLKMQLNAGSGAYYSYAQLLGTVNNYFDVQNVSVDANGFKLTLKTLKVRIYTETVASPALSALANAAPNAPEGAVSTEDAKVTDTYAFALDFWFRTNAAGSYLKLQTEGTNRIYEDGANAEIEGKGSTATFTSTDAENFTGEDVKNLMSKMRLVFVGADGTIYAWAGFDTSASDAVSGGSVTGKIVLMDVVSYDAAGVPTLASKANTATDEEKTKIVSLDKNVATMVSVYVYLDGDKIENSDVAALDASSMTGVINLQFASSAELVPMDYSPLKGSN